MTLRFNKRLSITPITESGGGGGSAKGSFDKATQTLTLNNAYIVDLINQATSEQVKENVLSAVGNKDVIFDLTNVQTMFEKIVCYGNITLQGNPISAIIDMSGGDYSVTISEGIICLNSEGLSALGVTLEQIIQMGGAVDENVFTITGTQGNYDVVFNEPKEYEKKYGADVNAILGDVDADGVLQVPTEQVDLVFTGVKKIVGEYTTPVLKGTFQNSNVRSVSFPDLEEWDSNYSGDGLFRYCKNLTTFSVPKLKTIKGRFLPYGLDTSGVKSIAFESLVSLPKGIIENLLGSSEVESVSFPELTELAGWDYARIVITSCSKLKQFNAPKLKTIAHYANLPNNSTTHQVKLDLSNNTVLESITFPALDDIRSNRCISFYYDTSLQSVSFPALKSTSFYSGLTDFGYNMLQGVTGCTVHFPSNLQNVIGSWTSVQNGFGGTNTVVLFDLPATE